MKSFHDTVWKITAALILIKPGIDEKLVFALTRAPLKLFNAATMKVKYSQIRRKFGTLKRIGTKGDSGSEIGV